MSVILWHTREVPGPSFESTWRGMLARSPHAHFALEPDYLAHEAMRGRHALAVLMDEGAWRAAVVLREARSEWVSGWPWRWQAVVEGAEVPEQGVSRLQAQRLFERVLGLAKGRRIRLYLPGRPAGAGISFVAGATCFASLERSEEELLAGLDEAKRRMVKRARSRGYRVVDATDLESFRSFALLQGETERRRGTVDGGELQEMPPAGEGWREWELPWMWLLVAVKEGVVEAGSGFGIRPGGSIEYRTNASSLAGKKDGANALLAWEAIRMGRERGFRRINWCGATRFKRELGGTCVEIGCRLGGGALWTLPNLALASARNARSRVAALWKGRTARDVGGRRTSAGRRR